MQNEWECIACGSKNKGAEQVCSNCGVANEKLSSERKAAGVLNKMGSKSKFKFECVKCQHTEFEVGELRGKGGLFSSIFQFNNKRFYHISCKSCGYSEFYKRDLSSREKAIDLFTG
ncbi:zinc ribbon domain-containing protein [Pseudoalteromonas luteoviolacea]|uniref:Putative nucleic-acid-binding protein containing a Zn-ribbon domain protein n=1 Tax=Pseudoalteromonas luteoviolacea (strain 2ta16) TaxID=1353533 RepID=V4HNX3_PSEL2|nr:zinc ribbon domain-containing protein [Pseudoalteromonas luteoviolacea]ESP92505.1 putative nucleic-acid-binding protein containing a Zn-ribbon domain protein [Pseudoalteromonas luteoviolacea 2ta16]KZN35065.1 hypothetical protein N483_24290 [Pseudoalteromonas luteoviolacea NCIMB 1944]